VTDPNALHLRAFTPHLEVLGRSPRTIQASTEAARQLAAFHGGFDLAEVTRADVEAYLHDVMSRFKPVTAAARYRSLHQYLSVRAGLVRGEHVRVGPRPLIQPATHEAAGHHPHRAVGPLRQIVERVTVPAFAHACPPRVLTRRGRYPPASRRAPYAARRRATSACGAGHGSGRGAGREQGCSRGCSTGT
jgi:hypothetical protein